MAQQRRSRVRPDVGTGVASAVVAATDTNPFGGLSEAEARSLAASYAANVAELAAPEFSIALESVARAVAQRMDNVAYATEKKRLAFFFITDRPRVVAERIGAIDEPIIDNGTKALCGWILVTGANCRSGYSCELTGTTTGELFKEVIEKGIGTEIALVFDPNATDKELRYYPKGVAAPTVVQRFSFRTMTFTMSMLDSVLKRLHDESLLTPDAAKGLGIWHDAAKYRPIKDAEARFQGLVRLTLSVAFDRGLFSVWWEVPGTQGRCDLFITSRDANDTGHFTAHAVLELKVLRSFSSGGSQVPKYANTAAIKKGVSQAQGYRRDKHALNAMLCCFDMRTPSQSDGDKCFNSVRATANKHGVHLRSYRLYASPDDLRADRMTP